MPRFEEPIDSAKQLIENNITLLIFPGGEYWVQFLANSPIPEYQTLSKHVMIAKTMRNFHQTMKHGIMGNGTHARMSWGLTPITRSYGMWWRGNPVLGNYPYGGDLSDKKWHLNEASNIFSFKKFETSIFF